VLVLCNCAFGGVAIKETTRTRCKSRGAEGTAGVGQQQRLAKKCHEKILAIVLSSCLSIVAYCAEPIASIESAEADPSNTSP
jgi:hypothetical protein